MVQTSLHKIKIDPAFQYKVIQTQNALEEEVPGPVHQEGYKVLGTCKTNRPILHNDETMGVH